MIKNNADHEKRYFQLQSQGAWHSVECAFGNLVCRKWTDIKMELKFCSHHIFIVVKCICLFHNIIINIKGVADTLLLAPLTYILLGNKPTLGASINLLG